MVAALRESARRWQIDGEIVDVDVHVGQGGQLLDVLVQRWTNVDGGRYSYCPFGVAVKEERTFGGVTIASSFRAGRWWGTARQDEGEFFRAAITDACFHP